MRRSWQTTGILGALLALSAVGPLAACDSVLGITPATVDPTISTTGVSDAGKDGNDTDAGDTCATYCDTIQKNCTGGNLEYTTRDICMSMCAQFDPGQPTDSMNDSLACRMGHAKLAATDPVKNCQQAGPLAAGTCTKPCGPFCVLAFSLCNPMGLFAYKDVKTCKTACEAFPYVLSANPGDAGSAGDLLFLDGDTLNCRLYHLESAYNAKDPNSITVHCPHTAVSSATCQ